MTNIFDLYLFNGIVPKILPLNISTDLSATKMIYLIFFLQNENSAGRELEYLSTQPSGNDTDTDMVQEENPVAVPVTVNNIDVNPDEIRQAASGQAPVARSADGGQTTVARSADGDSSRSSRSSLPYSYRNYRRSSHDHSGEIAYPYRSVYIPSHGHYHYNRQSHDHEAEKR